MILIVGYELEIKDPKMDLSISFLVQIEIFNHLIHTILKNLHIPPENFSLNDAVFDS